MFLYPINKQLVSLISLLLIRDVTLNPGVLLKLISKLLNIHHMTNYMINCFTFRRGTIYFLVRYSTDSCKIGLTKTPSIISFYLTDPQTLQNSFETIMGGRSTACPLR